MCNKKFILKKISFQHLSQYSIVSTSNSYRPSVNRCPGILRIDENILEPCDNLKEIWMSRNFVKIFNMGLWNVLEILQFSQRFSLKMRFYGDHTMQTIHLYIWRWSPASQKYDSTSFLYPEMYIRSQLFAYQVSLYLPVNGI